MIAHPVVAAERATLAGAAVAAASEVGLLDALSARESTPGEAATDLNLDKRLTTTLLAALAELGVLDEEAGVYHCDPNLARIAPALSRYRRLSNALRGADLADSVHEPEGAAKLYPDVVGVLGGMFNDAAAQAADVLVRDGARVLDLGSGSAVWSRAIAERDPDVRVVAVDLPDVVPATRSAVQQSGLSGRFDIVAGDFHGDLGDVGGSFDLVLLANVCHLFDTDGAQKLVGVAASFLAERGSVAVIDIAAGADGSAIYALGLAMRTATGGVHSASDYAAWLEAAGLVPMPPQAIARGFAVTKGSWTPRTYTS